MTNVKKIILFTILVLMQATLFAQKEGRAVKLPIVVNTQDVTLLTNDTLRKSVVDTIDLVAGDNITIEYTENGIVTFSSSVGSILPTCAEGEFLAVVGGEWTCVNVCDFICADTIISIVNNYNDTVPSVIAPSGDVTINFSRLDCEDSTQILATTLASSTLNLTTIKIATVPTVGELHYNGVLVIAGQELSVTLGSLDTALYYVSDASTGSSYADLFTFQLLYSSNASYLGAANVNVSVDACVTESVCFGYLYNYYALTDARNIANEGWYVPDRYDFSDALGSYGTGAAIDFIVGGDVFWNGSIGTNSKGLSIIGSGERSSGGTFQYIKDRAYFRLIETSTVMWEILPNGQALRVSSPYSAGGFTRLVKDATGLADGVTTTYTGNDGKTYNAVVINELYWTTENLEETQYRNGDYIPNVEDNTTWANLTTGALCLYDNDDNNSCKGAPIYDLGSINVSDFSSTPVACYTFTGETPDAVFFTPNGEYMYVGLNTSGLTSAYIKEYQLSTPWNPSSASPTGVSLTHGLSNASEFKFNKDGSKLYIITHTPDYVREYDLSSPYAINTASLSYELLLTGTPQTIHQPWSFFFSDDGTKLVVADYWFDSTEYMFLWDLATPWDLSTATVSTTSKAQQSATPFGGTFAGDGARIYIANRPVATNGIQQYNLTTPYDISTATYTEALTVSGGTQDGLYVHPTGQYIFVAHNDSQTICRYDLQ